MSFNNKIILFFFWHNYEAIEKGKIHLMKILTCSYWNNKGLFVASKKEKSLHKWELSEDIVMSDNLEQKHVDMTIKKF